MLDKKPYDLLGNLTAMRCPSPVNQPPGWHELLRVLPFRYPFEDEQYFETGQGRRILLRPVRVGDTPAYTEMFQRLHRDDVRFRFFSYLKQLPDQELQRFQQIDYDLNVNFVALGITQSHEREMLGVVGATLCPEDSSAEFGLLIRTDQKGHGLGRALMKKLIRACIDRGIITLRAEVMMHNRPMLDLARSLGFQFFYQADGSYMEVLLRAMDSRPDRPRRRPR
ncbi:MAG: GNAT family N-acetyltransferase [Gammaproteobacteria bacterium]|nr:GNAT family N-acetyltransferase [Gammaproteobacteria bacterium]